MQELSQDAALVIGDLMVYIDKHDAEKTTEKLLDVCKKFVKKCELEVKNGEYSDIDSALSAAKEAEKYVDDAIKHKITYQMIYDKVHEYYSSNTFEKVR